MLQPICQEMLYSLNSFHTSLSKVQTLYQSLFLFHLPFYNLYLLLFPRFLRQCHSQNYRTTTCTKITSSVHSSANSYCSCISSRRLLVSSRRSTSLAVTPHPQNTYPTICPDFLSVFFILFYFILFYFLLFKFLLI